jgi:hypothetical protein
MAALKYTSYSHVIDWDSIVAIHGLGGHPIGSWTNKSSGVSWLTTLPPKDVPAARVMTYGYHSALQNNNSFQDLGDIAHGLVSQLRASRIGRTEVSLH